MNHHIMWVSLGGITVKSGSSFESESQSGKGNRFVRENGNLPGTVEALLLSDFQHGSNLPCFRAEQIRIDPSILNLNPARV